MRLWPSDSLLCGHLGIPFCSRQGVGKALAKQATELADLHKAAMWVHLSDWAGSVRAFEANGFKEVSRVIVDLDEYRTKSVPAHIRLGV